MYSTLFERLARQEAEAFKSRDSDDDGRRECPAFPRLAWDLLNRRRAGRRTMCVCVCVCLQARGHLLIRIDLV